MSKEALREASKAVGSMQALAEKLHITKGAVSQWEMAPAERVLGIAEATGWAVTPHQLRPDLYPHPDDGLPPEQRKCAA